MGGQVRIRVRYEKYVTPWFDYLLVSREEMSDILKGTGWKIERFLPPPGLRTLPLSGKCDLYVSAFMPLYFHKQRVTVIGAGPDWPTFLRDTAPT